MQVERRSMNGTKLSSASRDRFRPLPPPCAPIDAISDAQFIRRARSESFIRRFVLAARGIDSQRLPISIPRGRRCQEDEVMINFGGSFCYLGNEAIRFVLKVGVGDESGNSYDQTESRAVHRFGNTFTEHGCAINRTCARNGSEGVDHPRDRSEQSQQSRDVSVHRQKSRAAIDFGDFAQQVYRPCGLELLLRRSRWLLAGNRFRQCVLRLVRLLCFRRFLGATVVTTNDQIEDFFSEVSRRCFRSAEKPRPFGDQAQCQHPQKSG